MCWRPCCSLICRTGATGMRIQGLAGRQMPWASSTSCTGGPAVSVSRKHLVCCTQFLLSPMKNNQREGLSAAGCAQERHGAGVAALVGLHPAGPEGPPQEAWACAGEPELPHSQLGAITRQAVIVTGPSGGP